MGRAAQGPRGLAASTAPLASSLEGPLYLLAKTAGCCLTKQKQRPLTSLSSCGALCTCWGVAHEVRDRAWRLCLKCSLLLAAASRQTAGPYLRPELPIRSGRVGGTKKWGGPLRAHAGWLRAQRPLPPLSEGRCISSRRQLEAASRNRNSVPLLLCRLGLPCARVGGSPTRYATRPGVFALNVACCLPLPADRQLGLTA